MSLKLITFTRPLGNHLGRTLTNGPHCKPSIVIKLKSKLFLTSQNHIIKYFQPQALVTCAWRRLPLPNFTCNFAYENILHVNYFNFICETNFHTWIFYFIREIHASYTKISHMKFWASSFHMWMSYFIRENASISYVK